MSDNPPWEEPVEAGSFSGSAQPSKYSGQKWYSTPVTEFEQELRTVINRHSTENFSNTPDFVLANFLIRCLDAWTAAVKARDSWYGFNPWQHTPLEE